jgi:hypothetical protein
MNSDSAPVTSHLFDLLQDRACDFSDLLANVAQDESGLIRTHIHFAEKRALLDADLPKSIPLCPEGVRPVNFYCYEDAGMATGAFLAAQSLCYEVTGQDQARKLARAAFEGIEFIYKLGTTIEPGFFPKPYGRLASREFSRDQYLFVLSGLAAYSRICSQEERVVIGSMAAAMFDFWINIDYKQKYFDQPPASHLCDFMGSLFLGIASHASRLGREEKHWREYQRLFESEGLGKRMPETLRDQFRRGVNYDGAMYFRQAENAMMLKCMAVDEVWESDPANRELWRDSLRQFLDGDLTVALDPVDGLTYAFMAYERADDSVHLVAPGVVPELKNPLNLPDLTWGGGRKRPGSAQTAYAAAIIADRIKSDEALKTYRLILNKMTYDKFRQVTVQDAAHFVPQHEWEHNLLGACQMAYWLWAYWLGRHRGLISAPSDSFSSLTAA